MAEKERAKVKEKAEAERVRPTREGGSAAPSKRDSAAKPKANPKGWGLKAIGASLLGLGAIAAIAIGVLRYEPYPVHDSDHLSQSDLKHFEESQQRIIDGGGFDTRVLSQSRALSAIESGLLGADSPELQTLVAMIRNGSAEVRELRFFDSAQEDNDVIKVSGNGVTHQLEIYNEPTTIYLPYVQGGDNRVTITGVNTDEGPVTVGVVNGGKRMCMVPLAQGASRTITMKAK